MRTRAHRHDTTALSAVMNLYRTPRRRHARCSRRLSSPPLVGVALLAAFPGADWRGEVVEPWRAEGARRYGIQVEQGHFHHIVLNQTLSLRQMGKGSPETSQAILPIHRCVARTVAKVASSEVSFHHPAHLQPGQRLV